MTPRAPSKERVEELRERAQLTFNAIDDDEEPELWLFYTDLLAILDERETDRATMVQLLQDISKLHFRNEEVEAQLEKQRPLIEAVMAEDSEPSFIEVQLRAHMNGEKLGRFLRAALKLRNEK